MQAKQISVSRYPTNIISGEIVKKVITIFFLAFLCACNSPNLSQSFSPGNLKPDTGVVILSVTNKTASYMNGVNQFPPKLTFHNDATGEDILFEGLVGKIFDKHLLNENGWPIGRVIAKELKEGTYVLSRLITPKCAYHPYVVSNDTPKISFTVKAGQVLYVGNLDLYVYPSIIEPGQPDSNKVPYTLKVHDEFLRDSEHIDIKWPSIQKSQIAKEIAKVDI